MGIPRSTTMLLEESAMFILSPLGADLQRTDASPVIPTAFAGNVTICNIEAQSPGVDR